jgi:hypothetical protein
MREYVFTEKERMVLQNYLERGIKGNLFYVLIHRLRNHYNSLKADIELIEKVLKKYQS